jgi:hypothetical protein
MEFLPDPINDRPMKDLPSFVNKEISDELLFPTKENGIEIPNWKLFEEFMSKEGPMKKS